MTLTALYGAYCGILYVISKIWRGNVPLASALRRRFIFIVTHCHEGDQYRHILYSRLFFLRKEKSCDAKRPGQPDHTRHSYRKLKAGGRRAVWQALRLPTTHTQPPRRSRAARSRRRITPHTRASVGGGWQVPATRAAARGCEKRSATGEEPSAPSCACEVRSLL